MMSKIAILGCGPSGLVAANAVEQSGGEAVVFSQPKRSYIAGAQYSHEPILGIHDFHEPDAMIKILKQGDRDGYALKVYGDVEAPVSWSEYPAEEYPAWALREAYDRLWERWEHRIRDLCLTPTISRHAASYGVLESEAFDGIISTIPLKALCLNPNHQFGEQKVHIAQYEEKFPRTAESFILYNGMDAPSWYRESVIFGTHAYEWSTATVKKKPPVDGVVTITKPVISNCDCYRGSDVPFLTVGRYGKWDKRQLISDVQRAVVNFVWTYGG